MAFRAKPDKFPLWKHGGIAQWTKKVRGQHHYFGTDKDEALKEYIRVQRRSGSWSHASFEV
jgi:hypothetical protein